MADHAADKVLKQLDSDAHIHRNTMHIICHRVPFSCSPCRGKYVRGRKDSRRGAGADLRHKHESSLAHTSDSALPSLICVH